MIIGYWGTFRAKSARLADDRDGKRANRRPTAERGSRTPSSMLLLTVYNGNRRHVWDVGGIVALFAMSNRLAHWAGVPPNEEFYLFGRIPRNPTDPEVGGRGAAK